MTAKQKQRLYVLAAIFAGVLLSLALLLSALSKNLNHYYELKLIAADKAPKNQVIRVGGMVVLGSLQKQAGSLQIRFMLGDKPDAPSFTLPVFYEGITPDLFREGQGVLLTGELHTDGFYATQLLAKHDENYLPIEVKQQIEAKHQFK